MAGRRRASPWHLARVTDVAYGHISTKGVPVGAFYEPGEFADMFRRLLPAIFALLGAATVAACAPQTVYVPQPVYAAPQPSMPGCDTRFQVTNNSSRTVLTLQYSHSSMANWGVDQLGQNVLAPGRVWNARANNPGNYDFRITWAGGGAAELRQVNICRASRIVVTNRGLYAQ